MIASNYVDHIYPSGRNIPVGINGHDGWFAGYWRVTYDWDRLHTTWVTATHGQLKVRYLDLGYWEQI